MHYIIQKNLFREEGFEKLIHVLNKLNISYELVDCLPFIDTFEFTTDRKDVFIFGSLKLARISKQYGFYPGADVGVNHDYEVYSKHYKNNLLNYDSIIFKFGDDFEWKYEQHFIRPTLDTKTFTGKVFNKNEWDQFKEHSLTNGHTTSLNKDSLIQVATPKSITQEVRLWAINGKIITQSTYRRGSFIYYGGIVDNDAITFAQNMIDLFQLSTSFVIDVCLTHGEWKIVECGSISCAGFYSADMQKIIEALEVAY